MSLSLPAVASAKEERLNFFNAWDVAMLYVL